MRICLYEDRGDFFEPLSLTRPVFDCWCGLASLGERLWQRLAATERGALVRPALAELYQQQHPDVAVNDWAWLAEGPATFVNGLWLATDELPAIDAPCVGLVGDEIAFARPTKEMLSSATSENFPACLAEWKQELPTIATGGAIVHFPWELVDHNGPQIGRDLAAGRVGELFDVLTAPPPLALIGPSDRLRLHPSARIEPFVAADVRGGPVVIDENAVIASFTRLEGPCYIGPDTHVFGAKIRAGTTLGPCCRIGGEVECSIVHGHSNKYHDGFLGHAYVGEWVNLGAGTANSDLRSDYGAVSVILQRQKVATGRTKVGCFIGDHVKTGLNTLINTGSNIGAFSYLFPAAGFAPKYVPAFTSWMHGNLAEGFSLESLLTTAQEMMRRRQCELTDAHRRLYGRVFAETHSSRQRALREELQRRARIA